MILLPFAGLPAIEYIWDNWNEPSNWKLAYRPLIMIRKGDDMHDNDEPGKVPVKSHPEWKLALISILGIVFFMLLLRYLPMIYVGLVLNEPNEMLPFWANNPGGSKFLIIFGGLVFVIALAFMIYFAIPYLRLLITVINIGKKR